MTALLRLILGLLGLLTVVSTTIAALPRWLGDGPPARLVYSTNRNGNYDLYIMLPDGRFPRQVTTYPGQNIFPAWSPDGQWLAFTSTAGGNLRIFRAHPDGSAAQPLTKLSGADQTPAWSPDGQWIVYVSDHHGNWDLYRIHPNGSGFERLTTDPGYDDAPAWSPDGEWIAFAGARDVRLTVAAGGPQFDLYRMRADGSDLERLTKSPGNDSQPSWSPDGQWIVYCSNRDGNRDLYLIPAAGGDAVRLTNDPASDESPAWSPDGHWIAFVSDRAGGGRAIYVVRPDGSGLRRLTDSHAYAKSPAWSPPVRVPAYTALAFALGIGCAAVGFGGFVRRPAKG